MKKFGFLGSLFTAIIIAVLVFGIIYFFLPSISQQFFGFSWRGSQDVKTMRVIVTDILEDAKIPQATIDAYLEKWEDLEFQENLLAAAEKGKDSLVTFLSKAGEGLDFGSTPKELLDKLSTGFSNSALGKFTSKQLQAMQRLFSTALGSL
jgi:hypothetical protein